MPFHIRVFRGQGSPLFEAVRGFPEHLEHLGSSGAEDAVLPSRFRKLRQAVPADADGKQGHRAQERQRDEHFQQGEAPVHCTPPERETVMSISRRFLPERRNVTFSTRTPGCDSSACSHCTPCFR